MTPAIGQDRRRLPRSRSILQLARRAQSARTVNIGARAPVILSFPSSEFVKVTVHQTVKNPANGARS